MTDTCYSGPEPGPPTVLIVDDKPAFADLYAAWLDTSYRVKTANSREEALDLLDGTVDVLVLDRTVPDISGETVRDRVQQRGLDCRVAAVTASESDFDVLATGFDTAVSMPAGRDKLQETVGTLVRQRRYTDRVRGYYRLVRTKAALDAATDCPDTGRSEECERSEEYERLVADMDRPEAEMNRIAAAFDDEDFAVLVRESGGHGRDSPASDPTVEEKEHPETSPGEV